ncbi:hypothetical protein P7C71_g6498, partial [Lecanoromycetidae sp. Uapishka_2]
MVAARERYLDDVCEKLEGKQKEDRRYETMARLVALGSDQSHSSTAKAATVAGVRYRSIPCKSKTDLALTGEDLRAVLEKCGREGLEPFFLTTTLGTTATCAIDHFQEIKEVLEEPRIWPRFWIHVDAAYAGAALILDEYAHLAAPFSAFDSFNVNMHKWLLTNFDASCLYIRTRKDLTSAFSITPSYLRNPFSDSGLVTDYRDWQIPLGRRFRALKIWFVLRTYGVNGLKKHVRRHIELGDLFAGWIREREDIFEIIAPPAFALTVLTISPRPVSKDGCLANGSTEVRVNEGVAPHDLLPATAEKGRKRTNSLTKEVYERINAAGEIFLTSTVVEGIYAIRVNSANERTDEEHLRKAFDILVATTEAVLQGQHSDELGL